jgi:amidase
MAPPNIAAIEGLKAAGIDMLADHQADLPPEYLHWITVGEKLSAMDIVHDQAIRTEVYDAIEGVLASHEILVSPTLACMPVDNAVDGNTRGPSWIEGVEVDPLIGWCLTYLTNFSGHPSCSVPAGLSSGLPIGMQLIGRHRADNDVLAAAAAFERVRPWQNDYRICDARIS